MPIYGYHCSACGHQKDVLQKMSDPVLTQCPSCGAETFSRQVSAPAFQLKGTGWYVTDFRDNGKSGKKDAKAGESDGGDKASDAKSDGAKSDTTGAQSDKKTGADTAKASESKTPAAASPAPAPAASSPASNKSS